MLPNGNMQYTLHSLKYCTGPVLGGAGLAGEKNFRSPVVHHGGGKYTFMMSGWFRKLVGICLGTLIAFGFLFPPVKAFEEIKRISLEEVSTLDCKQTSLIKIFKNPAVYIEETLCFTAYVYYSERLTGFTAFHPAPLTTYESKYGEVVILKGIGGDLRNEIHQIPSGFQVFLLGEIDDLTCWTLTEEVCTPYEKPIFFKNTKIFIIR